MDKYNSKWRISLEIIALILLVASFYINFTPEHKIADFIPSVKEPSKWEPSTYLPGGTGVYPGTERYPSIDSTMEVSINICSPSEIKEKCINYLFNLEKRPFKGNLSNIVFAGDSNILQVASFYPDKSINTPGQRVCSVFVKEKARELGREWKHVAKLKPRKLFISIGIKDVEAGVGVAKLKEDLRTFVNNIQDASPGTCVYFVSGLPYKIYLTLSPYQTDALFRLNRSFNEIDNGIDINFIDLSIYQAELQRGSKLHLFQASSVKQEISLSALLYFYFRY